MHRSVCLSGCIIFVIISTIVTPSYRTVQLDDKRTFSKDRSANINSKGIESFFDNDPTLIINQTYVDNCSNPSVFQDSLKRLWVVWGNSSRRNGTVWASYASEPYEEWRTPFRITDDPRDDCNPVGVVDKNGSIWIFWQSNRDGYYNIWYKNFSRNGRVWSQAYQLTNHVNGIYHPNTLVDQSNNIWVFYEVSLGEKTDIVYQRTNTSSFYWEKPKNVSLSDPLFSEEIHDCQITDSGTIYLCIQELQENWATFIWSSADGGQTWIKNQVTPYDNSEYGTIYWNSSHLNILSERNNCLYLSSSTDQEWVSAQINLSEENSNRFPQCCRNGNKSVFVVWLTDQNGDWQIDLGIILNNRPVNQFDVFFPISIIGGSSLLLLLSLFFLFKKGKRLSSKKIAIPHDQTLSERIFSLIFIVFGKIVIDPSIRRLSISQVQDNTARILILNLLAENEFMHFRELKRRTGCGAAQLKWHLHVLIDFGFVQERKSEQYLIYHLTSKPPDPAHLTVYFNITTNQRAKIANAFLEFEKWSIDELSTYLRIPKRSIKYHCDRLIQKEILIVSEEGFFVLNPKYVKWVEKTLSLRTVNSMGVRSRREA